MRNKHAKTKRKPAAMPVLLNARSPNNQITVEMIASDQTILIRKIRLKGITESSITRS